MPITFLDEEDNTGIYDTSLIPSIQPQKRKVTFLDEEPEEEIGTLQGIANSAQNAFDSSKQALLAVGGVDQDQAEQISKLEYAKQARKAAPGYAEYQKAEGMDAVGAFLRNPVEVTTNIIGEGLAGSLPALGAGLTAGAAGAAVGSVVPGIGTGIGYTAGQVAGTFGGSLSTEYGSKILEELQNSGMDITDPNSIQSYFSNEEKLAPIREKALLRGVPVAAFDAVSAGIGGKLGRVFGSEIIKEGEKVLGKKFATKTGEALTELGAQAILGGGGEVAGSVAAGDKVNLKDVFAEVIGEVGPGAAEVIQGRIADRANQRKLTEAKANQNILNISETLEQNNAPLTAQATTQELAKQLSDDLNADREEESVELADLGGQTLKKINEVKAETQTATTKEEVAANLSEEDLNTREQDARKLVQQYKDAFFESQDPNDRAKAVEFQGVLDAIKAEKQKRKAAPAEAAAPAEPQAVKPLPTDYLPTETPGATYGRESEIYDAFANVPRKTTEAVTTPTTEEVVTPTAKDITAVPPVAEAATLPVEQAPLTQQAVAQQVEKQPYATQEIIQPEGIRQEPQDGTQAQPTAETIARHRVFNPEGSKEEGQVTPVVSDLQSVASNTATPEQLTKLSQSGLVDIVKGQPVINEDGQAALTQAQAPLPKLTPEERRAEIEAAPVTPTLSESALDVARKTDFTSFATREEAGDAGINIASQDTGLPPPPPAQFQVLESISNLRNRKPYNPDVLTESAIQEAKNNGWVIGKQVGKLKFTESGRNQLRDWSDQAKSRYLAEASLQDEISDFAVSQWDASRKATPSTATTLAPVAETPAVTESTVEEVAAPDTFENRESIENKLKDLGDNVYYHGSDDILYLNSKEDFNTSENTKNAKSKYVNLTPQAGVAISYSIRQQKIGEKSGVAAFKLKGSGYTMRNSDIKTLKSNEDYEAFYDKKKSEGYDYVKVPQDANDIVVLNNNAIEYIGKKLNKEAIGQPIKEAPVSATSAVTEAPAAEVAPTRNWESYSEELRGDLESFSAARGTGRIDYDMMDVADRFVEFAKNDKSGNPLSKLVTEFSKTDFDSTTTQIKKLRTSVKSVEQLEQVAIPPTPAVSETPAAEVVTIQRDITKPEQMTPAMFMADRMAGIDVEGTTPRSGDTRSRAVNTLWDAFYQDHQLSVKKALVAQKPVSSKAVESYGITLPEGYVKQGDLYVYQPAVSETITPAAPKGPQVGQRVRSGSTPQPFVITEVTPQTARDVELGEQYYKIKNERTGEESVVESVDITPIKTTRSSKKLKAVYPIKGGVEVGDMNVSQRMEDALAKITPKTPEEAEVFQKALSNKMMARNPELAIAAVRLKNGEITAGEYADLIDIIDPFTIKGSESIPTKSKIDQYIDEGKKNKVNAPIENGKEVEFRIDIPTYNRSTAAGDTVYAVTAHEPVPETSKRVGIPISYVGVAKVINPKMMTRSISGKGEAIDIATGSGKFPLATVKGNYEAITELPADINDPNAWTEVSYNPIRSSYFVDVRSKNAVVGGEEAIMVGSRVFVKNPQTQARPTGVVGGNGVTDIRYARARDKAKYRQKYKSIAIQEKVQNYIKIAQDEMQEAIDNKDIELAENIQKNINTAFQYNINESELYTQEDLVKGVANFFNGSIPDNVIFVEDIGFNGYALYNTETGQIEINRAYFKEGKKIDSIIAHELGHYAFGDPVFRQAILDLWNGLTPQARKAISRFVEKNYSDFDPDSRTEEKIIYGWEQIIEANPEVKSSWDKFVQFVNYYLNKYIFRGQYVPKNSTKVALDVLNSIRQEFINGKSIIREDGSRFTFEARVTEDRSQVHGNVKAGDIISKVPEFFAKTDKIISDDIFDFTQLNQDNTDKAWSIMESLKDQGFARSINEQVMRKMDSSELDEVNRTVGVQRLKNSLKRYGLKLLAAGDPSFNKAYNKLSNKLSNGLLSDTDTNIATTLGAKERIEDQVSGASEAQTKGEKVQTASTLFGTPSPTKEQIDAVETGLEAAETAENLDIDNILDSVVSAESKTGVNIRKDIDAAIKKSRVKQKTVDDVIGSTETGKSEFSGVDTSTAKASIKKQATSPIDAQAERAIEGLAKLQSDVQAWPNKTQNQVRSIVQQDLRQRPDMARKEAWKSLLTSKLMNAGVSESNAMTLSDLVWKQHEINNMNREIKLIESAAENGSLGVIVEMIKNTPLQQQSTPEWRKEVIRQYLMSAGLSEKQAESAARLYDNIIAEKIAEAKQKAFEQSISKTSPWRDHMSRNGQLAKDALKKVLNAVRTSALDPTQNTESIIAKQNGWTGFSEADFRRIAEIDDILNNSETDDLKKSEVMKELNEIISKTKLPVTVKQALAAYYTGQALMGVPTVTVNIFSPLGFSLRNLVTDIGRFALTDPTRIPLAFDTFLDSMRSWYNQTKYAFKNEVYPNDVVEYLNGNNVLKELYNKGKKEWKNGEYGSGMRDMLIGMTQITGRVLSALDQGAISALENQAVNRYAMEAMSLSNIPRSKRNAVASQILQAKRNTYASLIASGMEKERAGVLSDMEMKNEIKKQLSSLNIESEKVNDVINSAINDALLSVGRNRTISMDGLSNEQKRLSDSGMASYLPIKFLEQMASSAAQQGPAMQIFSKMLYGFALVPARTFHNAAWYSPYGFLRIFRDKYQKSKGMESSYALSLGNELQYRQRLTESIAGSVAMLGLAALVGSSVDDDDDDKKFKIVITGNGPDAAADKQFADSYFKKYKPNSFHIVIGKTVIPINIGRGGEAVFFPIMLAGALDDWKIRNKMNKAKKNPADLNQATVMLGSAFLALAQRGPYAAFGKSLFNANRAGQLPEELAAQAGYFGKTFVPVLGTSIARNISDFINDPVDKSSMSGAIYSNIPIVGPMIGTKALNAFGQPIRADDWGDRLYKLGVPMVFSFPKNTPENALNELVLSKGDGPTIPTRRTAESRLERPLTNEEFYAYVKTYGDSVSKNMFRHRNSLERMDSSRYQSELEDYSKDANERATRAVKRMSMR